MNVLVNTITQPVNDSAAMAAAIPGSSTLQIAVGIGRHCQNNSSSVRLAHST